MEARTFIFFGPSGAGKGTQAKLLFEYLEKSKGEKGVIYLSTGNLFRTFMESGTYTAKRVKAVLDEGGLPLEFLAVALWTNFFDEEVKTGEEHWILDGVARRNDEAPLLMDAIRFYGRSLVDVIVLNVSDEWAFARLKERGRYDDTDEEIKTRLDWFKSDVVPSIEYFRDRKDCHVHDIHGEQPIEDVQKEILRKVSLM